jgi:hypothetical protein
MTSNRNFHFKRLILVGILMLLLFMPLEAQAADLSWQVDSKDGMARKNPSAALTFYIIPEDTTTASCAKNDPCDFLTAWSHTLSGDTLIFMKGTYTVTNLGHTATPATLLTIDKSVYLYGGWDGDRSLGFPPVINPNVNLTILDGQDSYRIISLLGSTNTSLIDGFRLYNGYARTTFGGDAACESFLTGGLPVCGGAIYVESGSPLIRNNLFMYNVAVSEDSLIGVGGAIYASGSSAIKILNNEFYFNAANTSDYQGIGGAVFLNVCGAESKISENYFWYNEAASAPYVGMGAAIALEDAESILISRNEFHEQNQTGLEWLEGTVIHAYASSVDILDNIITDNVNGVVIRLNQTNANILRNYIINPDANRGLQIIRGVVRVENNVIADHAESNVYILGSSGDYAEVQFYFNTVSFNGTGTADRGYRIGDYVNGYFSQGIIANQYYGFKDEHTSGSIYIDYHMLYNNFYPYGDDDGPGGAGFGCIDCLDGVSGNNNPRFVNPANGDYHLQSSSDAIDTGPGMAGIDRDIDGQHRPYPPNGVTYPADLGADEYWPAYLRFFLPIIKK